MRIAFTSCCDVLNDSDQVAWQTLAAQNPDIVLLLGDNIYMDYAWGHPLKNGTPTALPLADFSSHMHKYYSMQWAIPAFRQAIDQPKVYAIWDDHDFAGNNSRGGGPPDEKDETYVPAAHRRLSRALFEQFRQALQDKPATYPPNPHPDGVVSADLGGIQQTVDLASDIRLHLIDGRSFRETPEKQSTLLGIPQRMALGENFLPEPGINLLASSTTLKDWAEYSDHAWLKDHAKDHRILVLNGDIHEPAFRSRHRIFEATASAMAQPPRFTAAIGKKTEVFGVIDLSESQISVTLWHRGSPLEQHVILRASWEEAP